MTVRAFVDTNVWVYAVDGADPAKQAIAASALSRTGDRQLVVSAQVLGEFYVVTTRKLAEPLSPERAASMVERMRQLPAVALDGALVRAAIDGAQAWGTSYWDALIVAAAASSGCEVILSEDLADGRRYGSVRVENPFAHPLRASESQATYAEAASWDDGGLRAALDGYSTACRDAGMKPNAAHSYWDYARRFLDWREGLYPRRATGRPVAARTVAVADLLGEADAYETSLTDAGLSLAAIETYVRHARFFARWLAGEFRPGARLARRR